MNREKRYQANPVVSCGGEVDGAVLYNPDTDDSTVVNLTGRELWNYLKTPRTLSELVEHLLRSYGDVNAEKAAEDVELFINTLLPDFILQK